MTKSLLVVIVGLGFASTCLAYIAPMNIRSPRALLMGDAYTAVADDDYTLFYNPAAMARHGHDFTLYPFNPLITASNVLNKPELYKDFPDTVSGASGLLMNYPAHAGTALVPGFKMFNFGLSFIASEQVDALLRNRTHPTLDVDYRSDRGVQAGFGIPLGAGRVSKRSVYGSQTNIGFGVKYIERTGLYDSLALTGSDVLNVIGGDGSVSDVIKRVGLVKGQGWGFDFGIEHMMKSGPSKTVVSLAALDITTTDFKVPTNPSNRTVAPMKDQVNLGFAYTYRPNYFHFTLSADIRALNDQIDFMQRIRSGVEIGIPGLSAMAGFNSGYYSYGAQIDLKVIRIMAGFYSVEAGNAYKQLKSDRLLLYLSLFDFSFDA